MLFIILLIVVTNVRQLLTLPESASKKERNLLERVLSQKEEDRGTLRTQLAGFASGKYSHL